MKKSRKFLELCQESNIYKETAVHYDRKLGYLGGRHILPSDNLILSQIVATIEIQAPSKKIANNSDTDTHIINCMTSEFYKEPQGATNLNINFNILLLSLPMPFCPKRFNGQCQACKK